MKLNQKYFGQEHFERGTPERKFCESLYLIKPHMMQFGFSERDIIPELPVDRSGMVQVKYNGMLSVIIWDEEKQCFVAWSLNGRSFFSLDEHRKHPVTHYFDKNLPNEKKTAFIGETYATRMINEKSYMTEFNRSMSLVKNPKSIGDVERIRFALFDYATQNKNGELEQRTTPFERFKQLQEKYDFPIGSESGVVHLVDHLAFNNVSGYAQESVQAFWDEYIKERGFEGLVLYLDDGKRYKLKYRDTLDVAIIAFRIVERGKKSRPVCDDCGTKFDSFWMKKLVQEGTIKSEDWFSKGIQLKNGTGTWDMYAAGLDECPLCGGALSYTFGPILGAKIALMTDKGQFVDIADGSQIPPSASFLDDIKPMYEADGYLWVRPEIVIEVSYQDLYIDRVRPLLAFDGSRYNQVGEIEAVSLRPYGVKHRTDKTVNPKDLRLEQVSYFVRRSKRIQKLWEEQDGMRSTTLDEWM
ncbi:MAG: hypothetical protein ACFFF4_04455 [Candidatus Thorarchaeota archaeon]